MDVLECMVIEAEDQGEAFVISKTGTSLVVLMGYAEWYALKRAVEASIADG